MATRTGSTTTSRTCTAGPTAACTAPNSPAPGPDSGRRHRRRPVRRRRGGRRVSTLSDLPGARRFDVETPDGVRLAAVEAGRADGPAVVLVHGYPDTKEIWGDVAARLADRFRIVAYDVRGAGESSRPDATSAYVLQRLADDFEDVLDAVAPEGTVHLVGHDWGSVQAWEFVTTPPHRRTHRVVHHDLRTEPRPPGPGHPRGPGQADTEAAVAQPRADVPLLVRVRPAHPRRPRTRLARHPRQAIGPR
ncbi:alpha/beta fold hydrolase [Yinghuangia aomiensis]